MQAQNSESKFRINGELYQVLEYEENYGPFFFRDSTASSETCKICVCPYIGITFRRLKPVKNGEQLPGLYTRKDESLILPFDNSKGQLDPIRSRAKMNFDKRKKEEYKDRIIRINGAHKGSYIVVDNFEIIADDKI